MRWLLLLGFGLIGLAALGGGVKWAIDDFGHVRSVHGIVVQQYEDRPDALTVTYYPVIEFTRPNGMAVRFRGAEGNREAPQYEQGTQVDVLYDPRHPEKARVGTLSQLVTGPIAASVFGLVILVLAVRLFRKMGAFEKALAVYVSDKR